jgi:hypothetical protein
MQLINNGSDVDLGNGEIFARGEVREFSELQAKDLMRRYPKIQLAEEPVFDVPPPSPGTPPPPRKVGRPKKSLTKKK